MLIKKEKIKYILLKNKYGYPRITSRLEVSKLLSSNENLSICRFGDGELSMILEDYSIEFQKYDKSLSNKLKEIVSNPKLDNMLVCLPDVFSTTKKFTDNIAEYWINWVNLNRKSAMQLFDKSYLYGDTNITRLFLPWKDKSREIEILNNIKSTWLNKHVIIVEGNKTRFGVGNDLFNEAKEISRILCPAKNAWCQYDNILSECLKIAPDINNVFVLALGPTASVLANDLCKRGYRALDLGHLDIQYEYLRSNASQKIIIPGKYNNEVIDGDIVEECRDTDYLKSIIAEII